MNVGETALVAVAARERWNDSGIDFAIGRTYDLIVPQGQTWIDWHEPCDADGYASTPWLRLWEEFRRVRTENWFKLIGTIGRSVNPPIVIGSQLLGFAPPYPGRLYLFANDISCMYWNNSGSINVAITRTE